jgi:pyridoxal phosphate enzyme (YggS family)
VAELIGGIDPERVRENLARITGEIAAAGRDPSEVEILAAVKYVAREELETLAEAGLTLLGENRAQDLVVKADAYAGRFTWDFIGRLQSRKVKTIVPYVRYIHSVDSDSVLAQLERHARADTQVLVEVNIAREPGKGGVLPDDLPAFIDRCPVAVVGLMTMPPETRDPEGSRPYFATLRELGEGQRLRHLSMGTSQDYVVAAEEGATIVRIGTSLYR